MKSFGLQSLILMSWLLLAFGTVLDTAVRWTDHLDGAYCGLALSLFVILFWGVFIGFPLVSVLYVICWRRKIPTLVCLSPALLFVGGILVLFLVNPPTSANVFREVTKVNLPASAADIHMQSTCSTFGQYWNEFYFHCSPEETERLIKVLGLEKCKIPQTELQHTPDSWPDLAKLGEVTDYYGESEPAHRFFMRTDESHERVYFVYIHM